MESAAEDKALGNQAFRAKNYHDAIKHYQAAIERADKSELVTQALHNLGLCFLCLDQPLEAITAFDQALARCPSYVKAIINKARALEQLGRVTEAWRLLKKSSTATDLSEQARYKFAKQAFELAQLYQAKVIYACVDLK